MELPMLVFPSDKNSQTTAFVLLNTQTFVLIICFNTTHVTANSLNEKFDSMHLSYRVVPNSPELDDLACNASVLLQRLMDLS